MSPSRPEPNSQTDAGMGTVLNVKLSIAKCVPVEPSEGSASAPPKDVNSSLSMPK